MRNRAYRIAQKNKAKNRAHDIYKRRYHESDERRNSPDPVVIGILSATPKQCSCPMCGNPRKHSKEKTMQEKRMECRNKY